MNSEAYTANSTKPNNTDLEAVMSDARYLRQIDTRVNIGLVREVVKQYARCAQIDQNYSGVSIWFPPEYVTRDTYPRKGAHSTIVRTRSRVRGTYIRTKLNSTHVICDADTHPHKPRVRVSDDGF